MEVAKFPETVTVRELQRNYRRVADRVKKRGTVFVLKNSSPDAVIVNMSLWKNIVATVGKYPPTLLKNIAKSENEFQEGKAKVLTGGLLDL